ncbi:family 14 glycosylhydrolase [Bacillus sp. DX4.1]|uniref:family 14 glycosylhydrolase n=1 Tax=Bacillus sp. DX4.1 TaxID=3055867 RepID=UPI0025A19422|nr:family 14 glycosylhydrolase [Bacillus sp. DX4.1]MDM5188725.1 family 14 glycosylhydrolase [Bacillus sp. DX4.1]
MKRQFQYFSIVTISIIVLCVLFLFPQASFAAVNGKAMNPDYKAYIMAPLKKIPEVTNWETFENDLRWAKQNGFYAITVDFWWGDMEKEGDQQFDFSYAQRFAQSVKNAGMKMVPILSTHQCGGNVGDDCNVPIPSWVWKQKSDDSLYFKSETGTINKETLNPLASDVIQKEYSELYTAFAAAMEPYKDVIAKIYLSGGPAGEMRYPSYTSADGTGYPSRGKFQAYTEFAKSKFRSWALNKYNSLAGVNQAWGTKLTSVLEILPPSDGQPFLMNGYKSSYGKDYLEWYQGVLESHTKLIGKLAHNAFDTTFNVPIGAKVAGVHWQYNNPTIPHGAEKPAGYNDYSRLLDAFKSANLDLTFTCLEMTDKGGYPEYSMPKTLVQEIAKLANAKGIVLNGENALSIGNETEYERVAEMAFNYNFAGFTLLRYQDVIYNNSLMGKFKDLLGVNPIVQTIVVKNAPTTMGDAVYISGDRAELGKWDTRQYPIRLSYDALNNDWRGNIVLPVQRNIQFKAFIKNAEGTVKSWQQNQQNWTPVPPNSTVYTSWW